MLCGAGNEGPYAHLPVLHVLLGNVLSIYLEVRGMRLPILWFAFCLLFTFWVAAFFFHLGGGLTTYSLLVIALALFVRKACVTDRV